MLTQTQNEPLALVSIDHVKHMVEQAQQNVAKFANESVSRETSLYSFRILAHVSGRQTGSTEMLVHLFNPETDVYVGETGSFIEDFISRVRKYNENDDLCVRFLNLNSKNLKDHIPNLKGEIKRVWFCCGGHGIYKRSSVVTCVIRNIEKLHKESLPIYVIV